MTRHTQPIASNEAPRAHKLLGRWDRGDGYDARDPNAPDVPTCAGCDALIFDGACADCTVVIGFEREASTGLIHCGEDRRAA